MHRIFLISPASTAGKRAQFLLKREASFALAQKLKNEDAKLGEVSAFLSGLYFRGKLTYAEKFASPPPQVPGCLIITAGKGLLPSHFPVTHSLLREFSSVDISLDDERYIQPLQRDLKKLKKKLRIDTQVILLGSVATNKYVDPLLEQLGQRLHFPAEFKGRGDMSRGALLLRAAATQKELIYDSLFPAGIHS